MADPFRSELEAAHARIEKLEAEHKTRVAELERENARLRKRLVDVAPPSRSRTGKTFFGIAMLTLAISLAGGMFFARVVAHTPAPVPIVAPPVAPISAELDEQTPDPSDFNRDAVRAALDGVRLSTCSTTHGLGHVRLTIAPSGVVTDAKVDRGDYVNTYIGGCIEARFREVKVPTFTGAARTVGKSFSI